MLFNLVKSNEIEEAESLGNPQGSIIGYTVNLTLSYGEFINYIHKLCYANNTNFKKESRKGISQNNLIILGRSLKNQDKQNDMVLQI